MSVIEHDFGINDRLKERRFARLLELDALHEANIRANPLPYLERASDRIFRLQAAIFEAILLAKASNPDAPPPTETVVISKAKHDRLKACLALLEQTYADYGPRDDAAGDDR